MVKTRWMDHKPRMRRPFLITVLGATLALTACREAASSAEIIAATPDAPAAVPSTPIDENATQAPDRFAQFRDVIEHHQRLSARVARISRRLRVANAALCDVTRDDAGLSTHRLRDYPEALQPLALHFMDIGPQGRFIRSLVPGSPADEAGLRIGDQILSGWPAEAGQALTITGRDQPQTINLPTDRACHIPTFVIQSSEMNAATDGREIDLSTTLVEQVGDDNALALIIAHEMAHVIRGHVQDNAGWAQELIADADALVLMRNAGFDIAGTIASWEAGIEAHRQSQAMSATHPPVDIRLRNLQEIQATIEAQPSGVLPLRPLVTP